MRRRPVVWLACIGAALLAARTELVGAIRGARAPLDVLLPASAALAVVEALWFARFLAQLAQARSVPRGEWALAFGIAAAAAVAQLNTPPRGSIDAITYALHGYEQVELGLDVYAARPADLFHGPLHTELVALGYAPVHGTPSPYGPLWSAIEALAWRAGGDLRGALHVFQGLGLVSLVACAALLAALVRRRERHGERRPIGPAAAALALLLCPLAPTEAVQDAHLDVTAYACVLGALWFAGGQRRRLAAPLLLAAAAAIKPTFGLYLPALAVLATQGRGVAAAARVGGVYLAVMALVVGAAYAPYWRGAATLAPLLRHAHLSAWTTPLTVAAVAAAAGLAAGPAARLAAGPAAGHMRRAHGSSALESADMTVAPQSLLVLAYWLPWYGLPLTGELLRNASRIALAAAAYLTLMGRLLGGLWFTAQQHYGASRPWVRELPLPGVVFQEVTLVLALGVGAGLWLGRRRQSPAA